MTLSFVGLNDLGGAALIDLQSDDYCSLSLHLYNMQYKSFAGLLFKVVKSKGRKTTIKVLKGDQIDHSAASYARVAPKAIRTVNCGPRVYSKPMFKPKAEVAPLQPLAGTYVPDCWDEIHPLKLVSIAPVWSFPGWAPGRSGFISNVHLVRTSGYDRASAMGGSDPGPVDLVILLWFYFFLGLLVFAFDPVFRPQLRRGITLFVLGNTLASYNSIWYLQIMVYLNLNLLLPSLLVVWTQPLNGTGSRVHKDLLIQFWIMYITVVSIFVNGYALWLQASWNGLMHALYGNISFNHDVFLFFYNVCCLFYAVVLFSFCCNIYRLLFRPNVAANHNQLMHAMNGNIFTFIFSFVGLLLSKTVTVTLSLMYFYTLSGVRGLAVSKVLVFIGLVFPTALFEFRAFGVDLIYLDSISDWIVDLMHIRYVFHYLAQFLFWFSQFLHVPQWIYFMIMRFAIGAFLGNLFYYSCFYIGTAAGTYAMLVRYSPFLSLIISVLFSPVVCIILIRIGILILDSMSHSFLGTPVGLYIDRITWDIIFFRNVAAFGRWVNGHVSHPYMLIAPLKVAVFIVRMTIRLPAELWLRIMEDQEDLWVTVEPIKHLTYLKISLSGFIFFCKLMSFTKLLLFALLIAAVSFVVGIFEVWLIFGSAIFVAPFVTFVASFFAFTNLGKFLIPRRTKEAILFTFLRARAFNAEWAKIVVPDQSGDDNHLIITLKTDLSQLSDENLTNAFWILAGALDNRVHFLLIYGFFAFIVCTIIEAFDKRIARPALRGPYTFLKAVSYACIPFLIPDFFYEVVISGGVYSYILFSEATDITVSKAYKVIRLLGLAGIVGGRYLDGTLGPEADEKLLRGGFDQARLSGVFIRSWVSLTRRSVLRFVETLEQLTLPEMVQAAYRPATIDSIRATYVTLREIGFPVQQSFIDSFTGPESSAYLAEWGSWRNWLIGTTNFRLGFRDAKVSVHKWVEMGKDILNFHPEIPGNIHTTTFTGPEPEIRSTARYWSGNHENWTIDSMSDAVEDLYQTMEPQFKGSKLATFKEVFKGWKKNFNMGFGFSTPSTARKVTRLKQLTRQAAIDMMGGHSKFLKAWGEVFRLAQTLAMPAPVFTKWENLKLKKSITRSVRTVIGSALSHHIMTTVFNYRPNHNYHIWETPVKIGMPLNGQNFNRLWSTLRGYTHVWAGDMTAFDSTQSPAIVAVVAEMRKKGFTLHKDYHKICQLIDISYDMLRDHPLGFKNLGDVAIKGQGMTTGHSSTSTDNSLMLVSNYLYAWRRVTGLRAREFFNFNKLANFGDDHILGYDPVFGWSPQRAIQAMKELGTEMRDESPGQSWLPGEGHPLPDGVKDWRDAKFSFLAKMPLPLTPDIVSELQSAGIKVPLNFATCHDKVRLLQKIKGQNTLSKVNRTENSYAALLAYMYLSAHHKDVFDTLSRSAAIFYKTNYDAWKAKGLTDKQLPKPPTYNQVLRQWYSAEPFPYLSDDLTEDEDGSVEFSIYDNPDPFGVFVRWLSDFPTLLSPRYANTRWADWLQQKLASRLSWPLTFIAQANSKSTELAVARLLAARTPYSFLRNESLFLTDEDFGVLTVRHWLYMWLTRAITNRKMFSPLDLVRLADSVFVNALFMLFGHVTQVLVELDLHVLETLLVYLLSFVNLPLPIPVLVAFIPSPSLLVGQLFSYLVRYFSPAGAIDYQPFDAAVRDVMATPGGRFVLEAPTGVGKSTRMINRLNNISFSRIVVIVPRRIVAIGVGTYMRTLYPNSGIGILTEGFSLQGDERIIYTTAQSFMMSPNLKSPGSIFVLDEAHIQEPHYLVVKNYFTVTRERVIYVTATPTPDLAAIQRVVVPAVNMNKILDLEQSCNTMADYVNNVVLFCNDRSSFEKILVFVPTKELQHTLAGKLVHKFCIINSKNHTIDESASVFIATNVADAGLTIPDVQFVFTTNIDIYVSSPAVDLNLDPEVLKGDKERYGSIDQKPVFGYYLLSEQTLKQRRGRTGRTLDGVSSVYTLSDVKVSKQQVSVVDFVNTFSMCLPDVAPYFPGWVKEGLPEDFVSTYPLSQIAPNRTWTGIQNFYRAFKNREDYTQSLLQFSLDAAKDMVNYRSHQQTDFNVSADDYDSSWKIFVDPQAPGVKVINPKWVDDPHPPFVDGRPRLGPSTRVNVSGDGLFCGARILQGLIYTHLHVIPSEAYLIAQIQSAYVDQSPENMNNFHFDVLREVAFLRWNLAVSLRHGNQFIPFRGFDDIVRPDPPIRCMAFLDDGHYNYFGVPVVGLPDDDAAVLKLVPEQSSPSVAVEQPVRSFEEDPYGDITDSDDSDDEEPVTLDSAFPVQDNNEPAWNRPITPPPPSPPRPIKSFDDDPYGDITDSDESD